MSEQSGSYYRAASAGVVAYLVGYGVTYLLKSGAVRRAVLDPGGLVGPTTSPRPGTWQMVAWLFNGMHGVPGTIRVSRGGQTVTRTLTIGGPAREPWLPLVPVVLLVLFGYGYADDVVDTTTLPAGAKAGASVALGYFPAALLGAGATRWGVRAGGVTVTVGVDVARAALVAGIGYPVVLGGVGGAVAVWERRSGGNDRRGGHGERPGGGRDRRRTGGRDRRSDGREREERRDDDGTGRRRRNGGESEGESGAGRERAP